MEILVKKRKEGRKEGREEGRKVTTSHPFNLFRFNNNTNGKREKINRNKIKTLLFTMVQLIIRTL